MNTNPSDLFMSLLLFSAVAVGLGTFYVATAQQYSISDEQMDEFSGTFNKYSTVDEKMKAIQSAIQNTNLLNPLTWGNVVILVINLFSIIFDLPGIFHSLITDVVNTSMILPSWTIWLIEGVVLIVVVFGALAAINKWRS